MHFKTDEVRPFLEAITPLLIEADLLSDAPATAWGHYMESGPYESPFTWYYADLKTQFRLATGQVQMFPEKPGDKSHISLFGMTTLDPLNHKLRAMAGEDRFLPLTIRIRLGGLYDWLVQPQMTYHPPQAFSSPDFVHHFERASLEAIRVMREQTALSPRLLEVAAHLSKPAFGLLEEATHVLEKKRQLSLSPTMHQLLSAGLSRSVLRACRLYNIRRETMILTVLSGYGLTVPD